MGIDGFLKSSGFIDGGVTGISMLLAKITGLPLSLLLPLINLPFIALVGYRQMGFSVRRSERRLRDRLTGRCARVHSLSRCHEGSSC